MKKTSGFTLIELILVIAILAIISTLAIQKLNGVSDGAKEKANLANVSRLGTFVEGYAVANAGAVNLDKLDSLVMYGTAAGTEGDTGSLDSTADLLHYEGLPTNTGLSEKLSKPVSYSAGGFGMSFPPILGTYYLTMAEVNALRDYLGIQYVTRGTDGNRMRTGDDDAWAQGDTSNPDNCCVVATLVTNGLAVAAVNPASVYPDITPAGAAIYAGCGADVVFSGKTYKVKVDGQDRASNAAAFEALRTPGSSGILLAFGIGDQCRMVGNSAGGLDSAPVSPIMTKGEYRRYLLLVRLRYTGMNAVKAEVAGVMDPMGRMAAKLR